MRGLVGLVLAVCLIGLADPDSLSAADDNLTPGLWINPELGLRGPMASQGNDRSRASITREECIRIPDRDDILIPSYEYASCLALAYVMELRPYKGDLRTETSFVATQDTVTRMSPVHFWTVSNVFYRAIDAEYFGSPNRFLKEHGPNFAEERFVEGQPWRVGKHVARWAVWAEGSEQRVAGLRFAPRIRLESHDEFYSFEVWGVGRWPESGDLVLVVLSKYSYQFERGLWGPSYHLTLLCYDPRLYMFRFINFGDYDGFRERNGTCRNAGDP